jgi:hypothetical protein
MAASMAVGRTIAATSIGLATLVTYFKPGGFFFTRLLNLFQANMYLFPGLIHAFKEDGGILSIAQGNGWAFNGPVSHQDKLLILIASKWGSAKLVVSFFVYYLELHNNGEHSTVATTFLLIESLVQLIIVGGILKKHSVKVAPKAPGRFRDMIMLTVGVVILLLNVKRNLEL